MVMVTECQDIQGKKKKMHSLLIIYAKSIEKLTAYQEHKVSISAFDEWFK